jgi:hypothetical protein
MSTPHLTVAITLVHHVILSLITYIKHKYITHPVNFFGFPSFLEVSGSLKQYTPASSIHTTIRIHALIESLD